MFSHERFKAYQLSLKYWELALNLIKEIPSGHTTLRDQLKRASSSISLNIAEGCGRHKSDDRKRFFGIARGSAMECAAISDLLVRLDPQFENKALESKRILLDIVNIISAVLLK